MKVLRFGEFLNEAEDAQEKMNKSVEKLARKKIDDAMYSLGFMDDKNGLNPVFRDFAKKTHSRLTGEPLDVSPDEGREEFGHWRPEWRGDDKFYYKNMVDSEGNDWVCIIMVNSQIGRDGHLGWGEFTEEVNKIKVNTAWFRIDKRRGWDWFKSVFKSSRDSKVAKQMYHSFTSKGRGYDNEHMIDLGFTDDQLKAGQERKWSPEHTKNINQRVQSGVKSWWGKIESRFKNASNPGMLENENEND